MAVVPVVLSPGQLLSSFLERGAPHPPEGPQAAAPPMRQGLVQPQCLRFSQTQPHLPSLQ